MKDTTKDPLAIRDLPADDRPYEKLRRFGARNLTASELMAVVIRSGTRRESALALCQRMLRTLGARSTDLSIPTARVWPRGSGGTATPATLADGSLCAEASLDALSDRSIEELTAFSGIGPVKAMQLMAAIELGRRASRKPLSRQDPIRGPEDAIALIEPEMRALPREEMRLILVDARNRVIRTCRVSEGGLSSAVIQPRELFREAVRSNAAAMILAHNHPSGDASPSGEDLSTTRRLMELGQMMGVKVIDHLIVGRQGSVSLKQQGLI